MLILRNRRNNTFPWVPTLHFHGSPSVDEKLSESILLTLHTSYVGNPIVTPFILLRPYISTSRKASAPFNDTTHVLPLLISHNINLEDNIKQLLNFIINQYKSIKPIRNITHEQLVGFKSLLSKHDNIHFYVSDKGGEFVLHNKEVHTDLATHHITSTPSVYRYVPPTRQTGNNRGEQPIINTSEIFFKRQIKSKTLRLETECNKLWPDICKNHSFDSN